jgi:hypothetical protein
MITGWPFTADRGRAQQLATDAGKGRFGLRSLETLTWFSQLWVPAYLLEMTVAQPSTHRMRQRVTSNLSVNVYDALEGRFLHRSPGLPIELRTNDVLALKPIRRETQIHAPLRKAVEARQKVTSTAAIERHNANLASLGIPTPVHSVSIDHTSLVHLPVYVGLLQRDQDRIIAVDGLTGAVSDRLSHLLTGQLAHIRAAFPR